MEELTFTDRDLWIAVRSGLLAIVAAYKQYGSQSPLEIGVVAGLMTIVAGIERRHNLKRK